MRITTFGRRTRQAKKLKGNDVVDAEMFQAEARRIERLLYRIARSYLNDDQEAEDAVQDALIKAWEKRKTLRDLSADPRDSGSGGERTAEEEHGALRKPHDGTKERTGILLYAPPGENYDGN